MDSSLKKLLVEAYDKGYRVNRSGEMLSPLGEKIKGTVCAWGYKKISLRLSGGKTYAVYFHRLVGFQKYGDEMFREGLVIRHLNGDCKDNSFDNIGIGTYQDNSLDIPVEERIRIAKYAASHQIKYDEKEVKDYYSSCNSYKDTMDKFGITSKGTLWHILNKR